MATRTDGNMLLIGLGMGILGNLFATPFFFIVAQLMSEEVFFIANSLILLISGFGFFWLYRLAAREVKQLKEEEDSPRQTINNNVTLIKLR